ncbi:hypothetical protein LDC_0086, partial [sediment metagenome]
RPANGSNGTKATGAVLDLGGAVVYGITDADPYTTIEWLRVTNWDYYTGVYENAGYGRLRNLIVHDGTGPLGIDVGYSGHTDTLINTIVSNVVRSTSGDVWGVYAGYASMLYNNTVCNVRNSGSGNAYGIRSSNNTSKAKNCLVANVTAAGAGSAVCYTGFGDGAGSKNNLSSDATAPGTSPLINKSAFNQFVDTAVATQNLHLKSTADAINKGDSAGLSALYTKDIDDTVRQYLKWDIGADEYPGFVVNDTSQWFVDYRNGVDAAGRGRSITNAFKHIEYCYDQLPNVSADSVYVINLLPGSHVSDNVGIQIDNLGPDFTQYTPLVLRSYYPDLDSMPEVAESSAGTADFLFEVTVPNIIVDRLHLRGRPGASDFSAIGAYDGFQPNYVTVRNSIFELDSTPGSDSYRMSIGISLRFSQNLDINNNMFIGRWHADPWGRGVGVEIMGGTGCRIINNTFFKVGFAWSCSTSVGGSNTIFANNYLDSIQSSVIYNWGKSYTYTVRNQGYYPSPSWYFSASPTVNRMDEVPSPDRAVLSYDWTSPDFGKLRRGSVFIDRGKDTTGVPGTDFYGIDSVGRRDIGACEFNRDRDPFYADTVNLFVDYDKADNSGDGRTILTAKKQVDAAVALIPSGTVDSTYVINLMPSSSPYLDAGNYRMVTIDGTANTFPSWNRCLVVQSYYSNKDSFAVAAGPTGVCGMIYLKFTTRFMHFKRLRFIPQGAAVPSCAIAMEKFSAGETARNIKISECVFDTVAGAAWESYLKTFSGIPVDSIDVVNCIFRGAGGSGSRVFQEITTEPSAVYGVRFMNNTVRDAERVIYNCSGRFSILNNIIINAGLYYGGGYTSACYANWNNYYPLSDYDAATVLGSDSIMRNPGIASWVWPGVNSSFGKLNDTSACIGLGKDSVAFASGRQVRVTPDRDLWGIARTTGNDLGACQYDPVGIPGKRIFQEGVHGGTYGLIEDTYIYNNVGYENYNMGALTGLNVGQLNYMKTLVRLPSFAGSASSLQVPSNAHVDSAHLYLYYFGAAIGGDMELCRATRDWGEGVGTNTAPNTGEAGWTYAKYTASAWGTAGATALSDREPVATAVANTAATPQWMRWNVTALVQDWISGVTNYGMMLWDLDSDLGGNYGQLYSSEYTGNKLLRPKLVVYYDTDTSTIRPAWTAGCESSRPRCEPWRTRESRRSKRPTRLTGSSSSTSTGSRRERLRSTMTSRHSST